MEFIKQFQGAIQSSKSHLNMWTQTDEVSTDSQENSITEEQFKLTEEVARLKTLLQN